MKEVAGKDEGQSQLRSSPTCRLSSWVRTTEKTLQEGSTQNLWLLKGPVVEDRMDGWMKTRVLAS